MLNKKNENHKVFIIAEAGVNHNGDIELAKKLIDVAAEAKVDAVKFQTWKTELIVTKDAAQASYQIENTGKKESQFEMLKRLELSYEQFYFLKDYCDDKGVMFLSTADEEQSASFLLDLQDIFKIGSGELTNVPFLRHVGRFGKEIILSTGMSNLGEVEHAISVLEKSGTNRNKITLLHANTMYPTPMCDVNLNAMPAMGNVFDIDYGYSDHTLGIEVPVAAVALGATCIEKHFTLDRNMEGPDHKASLEPKELKAMVAAIRNIEVALGCVIKRPTLSEVSNMAVGRKSIVANCDIKKGDLLSAKKIAVKRPGTGINPNRWDEIVNTVAQMDYKRGDLL